ncbi:unnamed protein product [Owenia fusiformis]|uniref:Uncharacterized protein n=1 Tax=Owenia fusiformis TaxID=6347 RepID=A0A8J1UDK7_OWEFU|nr:unnamed protein product [Owenia fusiformis]
MNNTTLTTSHNITDISQLVPTGESTRLSFAQGPASQSQHSQDHTKHKDLENQETGEESFRPKSKTRRKPKQSHRVLRVRNSSLNYQENQAIDMSPNDQNDKTEREPAWKEVSKTFEEQRKRRLSSKSRKSTIIQSVIEEVSAEAIEVDPHDRHTEKNHSKSDRSNNEDDALQQNVDDNEQDKLNEEEAVPSVNNEKTIESDAAEMGSTGGDISGEVSNDNQETKKGNGSDENERSEDASQKDNMLSLDTSRQVQHNTNNYGNDGNDDSDNNDEQDDIIQRGQQRSTNNQTKTSKRMDYYKSMISQLSSPKVQKGPTQGGVGKRTDSEGPESQDIEAPQTYDTPENKHTDEEMNNKGDEAEMNHEVDNNEMNDINDEVNNDEISDSEHSDVEQKENEKDEHENDDDVQMLNKQNENDDDMNKDDVDQIPTVKASKIANQRDVESHNEESVNHVKKQRKTKSRQKSGKSKSNTKDVNLSSNNQTPAKNAIDEVLTEESKTQNMDEQQFQMSNKDFTSHTKGQKAQAKKKAKHSRREDINDVEDVIESSNMVPRTEDVLQKGKRGDKDAGRMKSKDERKNQLENLTKIDSSMVYKKLKREVVKGLAEWHPDVVAKELARSKALLKMVKKLVRSNMSNEYKDSNRLFQLLKLR